MSDGMGREFTYLSSHATNRYFIPNWGIDFPDMGLLPAILVSVIAKRFHLVIDVVEFSMKAVVPRYSIMGINDLNPTAVFLDYISDVVE